MARRSTTNLFATAETVKPKKAAPTSKTVEAHELEGLEDYAALDALEKAVKSIKEIVRTPVTDAANEIFIKNGFDKGAKPENFKGTDGEATASIQLRQRSSASGLTTDEIEILDRYGIPMEEVADRDETYIFNPQHLDWLAKNGAAVSKALIALGAPEDIIQFQEATKKTIVTKESLDIVFTLAEKTIRKCLGICSSITIVPKFENQDKAFDLVRKLVKAK